MSWLKPRPTNILALPHRLKRPDLLSNRAMPTFFKLRRYQLQVMVVDSMPVVANFSSSESYTCAGASGKATSADGSNEQRVIALGLIGVFDGEFRDGLIECVVLPQVTCDPRCVSCPSVRPRQHPTAQLDIFDPALLGHFLRIDGHLHVAQLPEIII